MVSVTGGLRGIFTVTSTVIVTGTGTVTSRFMVVVMVRFRDTFIVRVIGTGGFIVTLRNSKNDSH